MMEKTKSKRLHPLNKPLYEPKDKLMIGLNFTEEDLAANREGYLTKKQRSELNGIRWSWKFFFVLAIAAIPLGTLWAIVDGIRIHDNVASRCAIISLIWIVALGIATYVEFKKERFDADLHKGDVQVVRGKLHAGERLFRQKNSPQYYIRLQGVSWNVGLYTFAAFKNGEHYAIYFAPHTKTLLSAELLDSERKQP